MTALKAMEEGKAELENFDARAFFNQLLSLTMAGFFSDPIYGGNRDKIAWKMIGFPGSTRHLRRQDRCLSRQALCRRAAIDRRLLVKGSGGDGDKIERHVDAVVIGLGFSGAILSRELTKSRGSMWWRWSAGCRPQSGGRVHADATARRIALCRAAGADAGQLDRHHHLPQCAR